MALSRPTKEREDSQELQAIHTYPDGDVVSLSPKKLLESDRFVCEICNPGFQKDQKLQMRRPRVLWKMLKRETPAATKRWFTSQEPT